MAGKKEMDSLIVDLDKVLDDFEAEETARKPFPGQEIKPSDFSSFVALKEDRPWEDLCHVPVTSTGVWNVGTTNGNNSTLAAYDIPYSPSDQFDLSEADFAPAVDFKVKDKPNNKLNLTLMNGVDKSRTELTNGIQDCKYPIQARDEFTPVYENQPFPPDLAPAVTNRIHQVNSAITEGVSEKNHHSLDFQHNGSLNFVPFQTIKEERNLTSLPLATHGDTSLDSGVNSIDSVSALSPMGNNTLKPPSSSVSSTGGSSINLAREMHSGHSSNMQPDETSKTSGHLSNTQTEEACINTDIKTLYSADIPGSSQSLLNNVQYNETNFVLPSNETNFGTPSTIEVNCDKPPEMETNFVPPLSIETKFVMPSNIEMNSDTPSNNKTSSVSPCNMHLKALDLETQEELSKDLNAFSQLSQENVSDVCSHTSSQISTMAPVTQVSQHMCVQGQSSMEVPNEQNMYGPSVENQEPTGIVNMTEEIQTQDTEVINYNEATSVPTFNEDIGNTVDTQCDSANIDFQNKTETSIVSSEMCETCPAKGDDSSFRVDIMNESQTKVVNEIVTDNSFLCNETLSQIVTDADQTKSKIVGFCDTEVDISDMDNYLNDLSTDGQQEDATPCDKVVKDDLKPCDSLAKDFKPCETVIKYNIMTNSDAENVKPLNMSHFTTETKAEDQITTKPQTKSEKDDNRDTCQLHENTVETMTESLSSDQGARPKELPVVMSSEGNALSDLCVSKMSPREVMPGTDIQTGEPREVMPGTDIQTGEPMDADLAAAIALSLQDSEMEEPAMMRRPASDLPADGIRPHSWGPSESAACVQQHRRPNSLNLPPRGEFGNERSSAPYTFPYSSSTNSEISPENSEGTPESKHSEDDLSATENVCEAMETNSSQDASACGPAGPRIETTVGKVAPKWIPDAEAPHCMGCDMKFTFTKRRHHCRGCGKVFCSSCCNLKSRLLYMDNKEARVCYVCHQQIVCEEMSVDAERGMTPGEQPVPSAPTGVLKRDGSHRRNEPKQVMFSDGIRPGGDLTELDGSSEVSSRLPMRRSTRSQKKVEKSTSDSGRRVRTSEGHRNPCLIPETGLPPVVVSTNQNGDVMMEENPTLEKYLPIIKDENVDPVIFALNSNLHVLTKMLLLDCCVNRLCWSFTTKGMCTVGQDEIVIVLEALPEEEEIPIDIFRHLHTIYQEASKGNTVSDMGHSILTQNFLDSREHGGFLYIKPTFQCLHKLILPSPPYLFGILLQKWETPWAKVFPIRLLLRLGAEYKYYPCPLISVRDRKPVFFEIGHTIMNLLADFRNFQYMLPQINGITIHMQNKKTTINFPRNRYSDLMKVVENSNEHVMAVGACFSTEADSHLVCIQNDDGNYQTQAINIQNKPRKVTGASFVVFNGALKQSSGLRAKSSIVEDGLMVQITPESMMALKQAIKDMKEYSIGCGRLGTPSPDEVVLVQWVREDKQINIGVKSPIDGMAMDGITSVHIPHATDYVGEHRVIRWTDVFFIENRDCSSREPVDLSRMAETLSNAACIALTPHLDQLKEANLVKIGLRVTLETEKVGYEIGSNEEKLPDLYMNDLDNELIPVIHSAVPLCRGGTIILELIFHILN